MNIRIHKINFNDFHIFSKSNFINAEINILLQLHERKNDMRVQRKRTMMMRDDVCQDVFIHSAVYFFDEKHATDSHCIAIYEFSTHPYISEIYIYIY